jgi:hypothetical protein
VWILIVVFAHLSVREGSASSTTMQEFQSRKSCEAARAYLQSTLGREVAQIEDGIRSAYAAGTVGVSRLLFTAVCKRK